MSTISPPAPTDIAKGTTSDPAPRLAYKTANHRERKWIPDPKVSDPDHPRNRTLILCFDGTGDSFDQDNSNVVQLLSMLKKDNPEEQLVYYQAGIGTYTSNVLKTPIREATTKLLDSMFANSLGDHIKKGYLFLMQNYRAGDNICIFGFSRGAFTARALAGMLQKVGLLPQCNLEQLPFAYAMYQKDDEAGRTLSSQFKETFSICVRVKFLGVWDTVDSTGLFPKHLPLSGSNTAIDFFRHALALDERRVKFIPSFWTGETPTAKQLNSGEEIERVEEVFFAGAHCDVGGGSVKNDECCSLARIPLRWMIRECFKVQTGIIFDAHMLMNEVGLDMDMSKDGEDIKPTTKAPLPLSSENLRLFIPDGGELEGFALRHIPAAAISALGSALSYPFCRIWDGVQALRRHNHQLDSYPCAKKSWYFKGEEKEELNDALSPIYDQLKRYVHWQILEKVPCIIEKQDGVKDDFWSYTVIRNHGEGRVVYLPMIKRGMKVHRSVKTRILASPKDEKSKGYVPRIRFTIEGEKEPRCLARDEWLAEPKTEEEEKKRVFKWVD